MPQPNVIAVRVANLDDKQFLLASDPEKFFTEPHYNGYPAVLLRLPAVTARELRSIITEAWRQPGYLVIVWLGVGGVGH